MTHTPPEAQATAPVRLTVVHSPDDDQVMRIEVLDGRDVTLGRDGDMGLSDSSMSRRHARIGGNAVAGWVEDLGSKNGTWVNGRRIEGRTEPPLPAVIRAGDTVLVVERVATLKGVEPSEEAPGQHPAHLQVLQHLQSAAGSNTGILLIGEPGTAKSSLAAYVHARSGRHGLLVSGRGAQLSVGSVDSKVREAAGGTLFIDDISEMSTEAQAMLAKLMHESRQLRLIAGTTVDLKAEVDRDAFRRDLYAAVSAYPVKVPPLRARLTDVRALFLAALAELESGWDPMLHAEVVEALLLHRWPTNERALRDVAHAVADKGTGRTYLDVADLATELLTTVEEQLAQQGAAVPAQVELEDAMVADHGNVARVAMKLGANRVQVYRWLERYGLDPAAYRHD